MINFQLTDDEQAVTEQVRRFAVSQIRPQARLCEASGVPAGLAETYVGLGLALAEYPESAGGAGLGFVTRTLIEEELAWGDPGVAAALPSPDAAGYLLLELDNADHWHRLSPFRDAARHGALAVWEAGALATDDVQFSTTADPYARGYRINGSKIAVAHGGAATLHVVACRVAGDCAIVAVSPESAGLGATLETDRLGLRALPSATVSYQDVETPASNVLAVGGPAAQALRASLQRARLVAAARIVGAARAAFEYASSYALERKTFGRPIADHQTVAFMVADMAIEIDAARLSVWRAARAIDSGDPERHRLAALAVAQAREAGLNTTSNAVQILGGHGYVRDHLVEKWMRDVRTLATWWGTPAYSPAAAAVA